MAATSLHSAASRKAPATRQWPSPWDGDGGTFVEWYSQWKGNDESAAEFCNGIYAGLLDQLRKTLER